MQNHGEIREGKSYDPSVREQTTNQQTIWLHKREINYYPALELP